MTAETRTRVENDRDLVLTRLIDAAPSAVYAAWTQPDLLRQWFAPAPYTTPKAELDVRPGGANLIVMDGPDGTEMPNRGLYLEVAPDRKLVFTDAFDGAWPLRQGKPFMVVELTFEDEGGKTRYTARVKHWTVEDRETHEKIGFHVGWAICAEQLAALVEKR